MAVPSFNLSGQSGPSVLSGAPKAAPALPMPRNVGKDVLRRTARIAKPRLTPNRNISTRLKSR